MFRTGVDESGVRTYSSGSGYRCWMTFCVIVEVIIFNQTFVIGEDPGGEVVYNVSSCGRGRL